MTDSEQQTAYRRVLLKLSGEALQEKERDRNISPGILQLIVDQLLEVHRAGVEIALVVGGGNIFRGLAAAGEGMERTTADNMGMLATLINALALQDALERSGMEARIISGLAVEKVAEGFVRRTALHYLRDGCILIFAAGTGHPFFTTDTAAALRAAEIGADILFKATRVDGVYNADPEKNPGARFFSELSYMEVLQQGLKVMDSTAISLCMENSLPVCVFNIKQEGNIRRALTGDRIGTLVS